MLKWRKTQYLVLTSYHSFPSQPLSDKPLGLMGLVQNHYWVLWMRKFRARAKQTEKRHLISVWCKFALVTRGDEPPVS